jgi:hypothetical protein
VHAEFQEESSDLISLFPSLNQMPERGVADAGKGAVLLLFTHAFLPLLLLLLCTQKRF